MRSPTILLATLLAAAPAYTQDTVYSGHGINSTGHHPAKGIVTSFWDIPEGYNMERLKKHEKMIPAGAKPGTKHNVLWRTTLPHWGNNAPVVIQGKVFLLCNQGWSSDAPLLVCIDDQSGKILWQEAVDHLDAKGVPSEAKPARAKEIQRYKDWMTLWNKTFQKNGTWARNDQATHDKLIAEADAAGWILQPKPNWPERGNSSTRSRWGLNRNNQGGGANGGRPKDGSLITNYKTVIKEGWHRYQGWGTEAPWYGMTHGSVVSDGETIYAVTGLGGAAAFTLDGKRKWAQWMKWEKIPFSVSTAQTDGHNLASPTLAGDTLVFYFFDGGAVFGLDTKTGAIKWKTDLPTTETTSKKGNKTRTIRKMKVQGGHMGPGSTPAIITVSGKMLAVMGNGMVVRVSDGKHLGWIPGMGRFYYTIAAKDDVVYLPTPGTELSHTIHAVRVKLDGDTLSHDILWTTADGKGDKIRSDAANMILDDRCLYVGGKAIDLKTGSFLARGSGPSSYPTGLATSEQYIVQRKTGWGEKSFMFYEIIAKKAMTTVGYGLLCEPKPEGDILARHRAFLGFDDIHIGCTSLSAWGKRLYLRTNDYLWCIGK